MKTNLRKALFVAAAMMMGVSAWADTTATFSPTAEYNTRPKTDGSAWQVMKVANSTNNTFEVTASANFSAVQQYKVTDLAAVKSLTITLYHPNKGMDAGAIWAVNGTFDKSMSASDFNTLFENTTGMKPGASGTTKSDYLLVNTGKNTKIDDSNAYAVFTISGDALTTLKSKAAGDGTITLLITNKVADLEGFASSQRKYYSIGYATEAYRPVMTVTYAPVYNVTTGTQYTGLKAAVDAAAANDEIKVMEDQSLSARVDIANVMTIDGNSKTLTINQKTASGFLVKAGATIKNATIAGADGGKAVFEFANSTDKTNFAPTIENVTVNNANVANQGVYRIKDYAQVTLKNVVNSGITVTDGYAEIFLASAAQTTACKLAGTNTVASVYFEAGKRLYVYGATISFPIALTFAEKYEIPTTCVIQGSANTGDFTITNDGLELYVSKTGTGANNEMGVQKKVTEVTANMQITAAGCATFCAPFDVTIPDGVKAYEATAIVGSWVKMTEITTGTIAAGTPVVLYSDTELASTEFKGAPTATEAKGAVLTGNIGDANVPVPSGSYILQNGSEGTGWYVCAGTQTCGVNRCYMTKPSTPAQNAKSFYGMNFGGETTAINAVAAEAATKADGKYFVNGQIVVVKAGKAFNAAGAQVK